MVRCVKLNCAFANNGICAGTVLRLPRDLRPLYIAPMSTFSRCLPALLLAASLAACAPPEGLRATPGGSGPTIVVDWDAEPLPELPFPNDLALRVDTSSPTGVRFNLSMEAPTELEREAREKANELTGFGIFTAITVSFDELLDLDGFAARQADDGDFSDDAIYVIDVTPGSPTFLEPVRLDVGHGRFPGDALSPDNYFPNDAHADVPSLLYDTHDEDVNGNGLLDPGEDVDNDGVLDKPNTWPANGDPREDLLTWYERETNTLMVRPVVPLREETTYAVVLTERATGMDGSPIRSPWDYVNHTRQTADLLPALQTLETYGLDEEDIGFAWTFTTARVTGDLKDLRRAIDGEGPWGWLPDEVPFTMGPAELMHDRDDAINDYILPIERIFSLVAGLGLAPEESLDALRDHYDWAGGMVGGSFQVPWFLPDTDDGGIDDSDEMWHLDPVTGEAPYETITVHFTCVLPKADENVQQPFPVANYGHGYGSTRLEFLGFAWAFARVGIAACSFDYPGHGIELDAADRETAESLLDALDMMPLLEHLERDRARDLTNDGAKNSGDDQWTSDAFHTRDMVRQGAFDHLWFRKVLETCGTGTFGDVNGDGTQEVACDWDADGVPDIGGPDVNYHLLGGSLGGINTAVAAGVTKPGDYDTIIPVVAGGGLMDVGWRSGLSGVRQANVGRTISPFFVGIPTEEGGLSIQQYVIRTVRERSLPVATLPSIPAGGSILIENLDNGEERTGYIPADGRFRLAIPADGADAAEKRMLTGIPETGPEEGVVYGTDDNVGLGDRMRLTIRDAEGGQVAVIDTWEGDVEHEGVTFLAGSPLVAGSSGLGHIRSSPRLRRIVGTLAMVTEPADPIAYAPHYVDEPFADLGGTPANVLLVPTQGDEIVPCATGIAIGRAARYWGQDQIHGSTGLTIDQWMVDRQIIRGDERWGPYEDKQNRKILFDADDLDNGIDQWNEMSDEPLRITLETETGFAGMRLPYVEPQGTHGFNFPRPDWQFDMHTFMGLQLATFSMTNGQTLTDDPCLQDASCDWLRPLPEEGR